MDGIDGGSHRLGLLHAEFSQDVHVIFLLEHFDVTICTLLDFNAKAIIAVRGDDHVIDIDGCYRHFSSSSLTASDSRCIASSHSFDSWHDNASTTLFGPLAIATEAASLRGTSCASFYRTAIFRRHVISF
ncbi:hypothetical protein T05_4643 [Trichinella murrelli]|uniref:Uncharacterized protein n=1 Tax=Trichinella murrelli TaxID=144512 RepID=A0A0V0TH20_9BILA|nr:hypothetical protein T05_4643 [Trichinella murrelli]